MYYLSDQIYSSLSVAAIIDGYVNYSIEYAYPYWYTTPRNKTLFTGRAFIHKNNQNLFLNDILTSYGDNYSWMSYENVMNFNKNKRYSDLLSAKFQDENNVIGRVNVNYSNTSVQLDVDFSFRDKRLSTPTIPSSYSWFTTTSPSSRNLLFNRVDTKVIPRIPLLLTYDHTDFFVGGLFAVNQGWRSYSDSDGDGVARVVILDKDKNIVNAESNYDYPLYDLTNPISSVLIGGYILEGNSPGGYDSRGYEGYTIVIAPAHYENDEMQKLDVSNYIPLAQFDECNADYYLIWCDRTGGYQCQPFHKKTTLTEDIATTTIVNSYDEERPMLRSITNKWQLNSDWLSYEEYKAYESIFTSPYTYLFDVKHNELTPVICSDKNWTEKTKSNNNKPFNLKITVVDNRKQNILY